MNETTEYAIFYRLGAMGILGWASRDGDLVFFFFLFLFCGRQWVFTRLCFGSPFCPFLIVKHTLYSVFPGIPSLDGYLTFRVVFWNERREEVLQHAL